MGLEFRPWSFLPLRTGASFGGLDHFNFALGFGLHFGVFDLDLASEHLNFLPERGIAVAWLGGHGHAIRI